MFSKHFNKDNLHHAYLLEGDKVSIEPEIFNFIESLGIKIKGNPDVYNLSLDSFKIEDARNLKTLAGEKSFADDKKAKRIFIISANNFLLEAQNTLLKMFEEPIDNTIFFLVVPDADMLLKTLISRFYFISTINNKKNELNKDAEKFISMPLRVRIDFLKEFLTESEDEDELVIDSARPRALKFLNAVEASLHNKFEKNRSLLTPSFSQIFITREFLRQPGSSVKNLMESVALVIPVL